MKKPSNNIHTERLALRISKDLLERIKTKAKAYGLSASGFVRMVLSRETEK